MTFGFEVMRANGSIMTNGLSKGGVLIDVLTCPAGTTGSKSYPRSHMAGLSYYFARAGAHLISLADQVGGDGTVQGTVKWAWTASGWQQDTVLLVFAKRLDSADTFGIQLTNDAGDILVDPLYPAPQFAGTVQLGTNATMSYMTPDGYKANVHSVTVNMRAGADKMILMNLPDSGANDTWYQLRKEYALASESSALVEVVVYTKAASYQLPSLHFYAVNSPISSGSAFTVSVRTPSQQITYDAAAEGFSGVAELQMTYVGYSYTTTYSLPAGYTCGVSVPFYRQQATTANGTAYDESVYVGVGRRVGTQLTLGVMLDARRTVASSSAAVYTAGGTQLRYSPVADISQLSPTTITGTPAAISTLPSFTLQPNNQAVHPGQSATFTVAATGNPAPTFQWYMNEGAVPGATSTSITLTAGSTPSDTALYCRAINSMGTVNSNTAYFTVTNLVNAQITSTQGHGGYVGDVVTFSMAASGDPVPYCTITGAGGISAAGYGSCSTTVTLALANSGSVDYRADNREGAYGAVDSIHTSITVTNTPPPPPTTPVVTQQVGDAYVTEGDASSFTFIASPVTSYQWYRNGSPVSGETGSGIYIGTTTLANNGDQYSCIAYNGTASTSSSTGVLHVSARATPSPVFSQQPGDCYVTAPDPASFACSASPVTSYQWYRNGSAVSGATGSGIYIGRTFPNDDGSAFWCIASYTSGGVTTSTISDTAYLNVSSNA
jgi:hypothetical protein